MRFNKIKISANIYDEQTIKFLKDSISIAFSLFCQTPLWNGMTLTDYVLIWNFDILFIIDFWINFFVFKISPILEPHLECWSEDIL